ncbi:MAG: 2-oxoacid:acceptor oxidoreductase family protein, partial [Nitrospinae bacterium]|nr:2-oxoacid:acceptor oxidoreductase family protein [Nitrospinota bacterium]
MGIGIGCSTLSIIDSLSSYRAVVVGPKESEGLLWMGGSAFSYRMHAHQGCGDGTYFHSARLNISFIRDAIEHLKVHYGIADTSQTLLYVDNSVVAMTGGQRPVGQDNPETAIATIKQEGIEHVALVAEFPEEFKHLQKKYGVRVYPKSDTLKVKEEYSGKPGLSVIWYVQKCGIEKSRERRTNPELAPKTRVHVNAEVCEDCGDCGLEAKCASVWKTDTEFGPKVRIHQYSCIQDFACARGECPSYVRVHTRSGSPLVKPDIGRLAIGDGELADPVRRIDAEKVFEIYSVGIGGWGLMTTYEILARAATSEGLNVVKEDDTGLSQKGGEVRNNIKISWPGKSLNEGFSIEAGGADLYIASDLIGAVNPENLRAASGLKTRAIVNTAKIPTMPMIVGKAVYPDPERLKEIVDSHTDGKNNIYVDATDIVENLFKDFKPTNLFLLGIAFQTAGNFPIQRARSVEDAIRINDVEAEKNIQAFRYGRLFALDPARVLSAARAETPALAEKIASLRRRTGFLSRGRFDRLVDRIRFDDAYQGKFAREIFELIRFQNAGYAGRFVDFVAKAHEFEQAHFPLDRLRFTKTVADNLFGLMAYKDEYRVADLLTRPEEIEKITRQYAEGEIVKIRFLLRPPILELIPWVKDLAFVKARFEKDEKWEFPRWTLEVLKRFKILRGTPLDIFAWGNAVRKLEREAIAAYRRRIEDLLPLLNESVYPEACEAASYPSLATGYDKVKINRAKKAEDFWREKINAVYKIVRELSRQTPMEPGQDNAPQENAVALVGGEWPGRNRREAERRQ